MDPRNLITCVLILVMAALALATWHFYIRAVRIRASFPQNEHNDTSVSYKEILRSLRNQEFLVNFANYLNSPGNFEYRINKALSILGKYTNVDRICIFEDAGGNYISNTFEWCKHPVNAEKDKYQHVAYQPTFGQWKGQLLKDGIIHFANPGKISSNIGRTFFLSNVYSFIVLPLYVHNDYVGFIKLENCETFHWDDLETGFLKTMSTMISSAFEQRLSEEELKNSEFKFKNFFNCSIDGVFIYDLQGNLLEVNNRACETLGIARDELLKKNIDFVFPGGRKPIDKLYVTLGPQDIMVFESEFIRRDGSIFPVEITNRHTIFNNKDAVWCVARDISERKEVQRQILSAIIQAEEKERGRLAQDLHDGLGPLLSSLKLYTKVLGSSADIEKREQLLQSTNEVIDESMLLIKEISNNLSPFVLNDFGLASAIQSFCKKITLTKEIDIKFDSNVFDHRFDLNVEMVLFRILKELVNNTIKHALASRIEIFLLKTDKVLSLIYSDNGIGFDLQKVLNNKPTGMGISNIVNRINTVNGRLVFDSLAEKGIQMRIEVELNSFSQE